MYAESRDRMQSDDFVTQLALEWGQRLAAWHPPLEDALEPLARAVWESALAQRIPSGFQAATRLPLGAYLAAFRQSGDDEAGVTEGIALLGDLITARIRRANTEDLHIAASRLGIALDAVQLLIRLSERTMRSWRNRRHAEAASGTATFAEVLGNELAGRLEAAIAALTLLETSAIDERERNELEGALTRSIQAARSCADDLMHISPKPEASDTPVLPLDRLVYSTVGRLKGWAAARDVEIVITCPPPPVRVEARAFQALLFNLVTVAVHRAEKKDAAIRIDIAVRHDPSEPLAELTVSSDAQLFSYGWDHNGKALDLVDLPAGSGEIEDLSLWLTAESADQLCGRLELLGEPGEPHGLRILFPVGGRHFYNE